MVKLVETMERSAEISECGRFRWWLKRKWRWSTEPKSICFVMLNPSTADAVKDDPTIMQCIMFAKKFGGTELVVRNLYPFRTSNPAILAANKYPTGGPRGNKELLLAAESDLVIAAWGNNAQWVRADWFAAEMDKLEKPLHCLGRNASGSPKHPLYLPAKTELSLWWSPES